MSQNKHWNPTKVSVNPNPNPGPTSDAGKSISKMNALKHGCAAVEAKLLPHESAEDLKALEATWMKAYQPTDEAERHLVQELVNADWLLQRSTRTYLDVESKLFEQNPNPLEWTEQQQRTLGRFQRYRTAHANMVLKFRKAVDDYRKAKANEKLTAQKVAKAEKKNAGEPTWKEHLANMKAKAISLGFTPPDMKNTEQR